jgi:integrase/recombinase XerD
MKPKNSLKTRNENDRYQNYLRSEGYSTSTITYHASCLSILKKWTEQEQLHIEQLSYNDLLAYIRYKQNKGTGKTGMSRYLVVIKTYYTYLTEQGRVTSNPAVRIKLRGLARKKLYNVFTPLELQQLYNKYTTAQKESPECLRNKVIMGLLIYQGVKAEELSKLNCNDVKLREGEIEIPGGKRSEARILQLEACQMMDMHHYMTEGRKEILKTGEQESEKLFVGTSKEVKLYYTLYWLTKKLKKIEPQLKGLEQLRASVISKWLKKYNLRQVQYMAGHRYISSTEKFLQNEMEGLTEEVNKFHPLG